MKNIIENVKHYAVSIFIAILVTLASILAIALCAVGVITLGYATSFVFIMIAAMACVVYIDYMYDFD